VGHSPELSTNTPPQDKSGCLCFGYRYKEDLTSPEVSRLQTCRRVVNPSHRSLRPIPDLRAPSLLVSCLAGPSPFIPFFFLPQVLSSPDERPSSQHVELLPATPRLAAAEKAREAVGDTKPPMPRLAAAEAAERATNLRVEGAGS
jgi:hypothetical protein